jgi:hypothetical protein
MVEHAYRAYEIGEDGHVRGRTDLLQCRNDQAAKEHAMRLVDGHAIELWDGPCWLAKFEPSIGLRRKARQAETASQMSD